MISFVKYVKEKGLKHSFEVIYRYKIDKIIEKILRLFLKNKPPENVIIIASHNDFDCNGGAFYDYLIKNNYNKKYKIIWLLRNDKKYDLPENVKAYYEFRPSVAKDYYLNVAKIITSDCEMIGSRNSAQKSYFFSHGPIGLKNVKGKIIFPDSVDYILAPSMEFMPVFAEQRGIDINSKRFVHLGYPVFDTLFSEPTGELKKITKKEFSKVILWMPTFRKGGGDRRSDSVAEFPMGIPTVENEEMLVELNEKLVCMDMLLIIKIHPMQDLSEFKLHSMSNIFVLTGTDVKKLDIDNYRLMREVDALISDYSAASYEFLPLNRPIGYDFSDIDDYKIGLCVKNVDEYIAGPKIYNFEQFIGFLETVYSGKDEYKEKRTELIARLYDPCDDKCCERIAKFMGL